MSVGKRFCIDWILGTVCTFLIGLTIMLCITMAAWLNGLHPFSIALGSLVLMEYQTGGTTIFAVQFGNGIVLLSALGGSIYGIGRLRFAARLGPPRKEPS